MVVGFLTGDARDGRPGIPGLTTGEVALSVGEC
jgi:hypothetical protein